MPRVSKARILLTPANPRPGDTLLVDAVLALKGIESNPNAVRELTERLVRIIGGEDPKRALDLVRPRRGRPEDVTLAVLDRKSLMAALMKFWLDEHPRQRPEAAARAVFEEIRHGNRTELLQAFKGYESDSAAKLIFRVAKMYRTLLRSLHRYSAANAVATVTGKPTARRSR